MQGIRFARGKMHHELFVVHEHRAGATFPLTFPISFDADWFWRRDLTGTSRDSGYQEYARHVAGRRVREVLQEVSSMFENLYHLKA